MESFKNIISFLCNFLFNLELHFDSPLHYKYLHITVYLFSAYVLIIFSLRTTPAPCSKSSSVLHPDRCSSSVLHPPPRSSSVLHPAPCVSSVLRPSPRPGPGPVLLVAGNLNTSYRKLVCSDKNIQYKNNVKIINSKKKT